MFQPKLWLLFSISNKIVIKLLSMTFKPRRHLTTSSSFVKPHKIQRNIGSKYNSKCITGSLPKKKIHFQLIEYLQHLLYAVVLHEPVFSKTNAKIEIIQRIIDVYVESNCNRSSTSIKPTRHDMCFILFAKFRNIKSFCKSE